MTKIPVNNDIHVSQQLLYKVAAAHISGFQN